MGFRKKRFRSPKITTVIGRGTTIEGNVRFTGGLHVDGEIKGNVISEFGDDRAMMTLSEDGVIEGNVNVANVMLDGTVRGDVVASNRVELAPKARITGTVTYALLEMEMGAEVNGKLIHAEEDVEVDSITYDKKAVSAEQDSAEPVNS